jgi:hypothetical protein
MPPQNHRATTLRGYRDQYRHQLAEHTRSCGVFLTTNGTGSGGEREELEAWRALRERYGNRDESRVDRGAPKFRTSASLPKERHPALTVPPADSGSSSLRWPSSATAAVLREDHLLLLNGETPASGGSPPPRTRIRTVLNPTAAGSARMVGAVSRESS